MRKILSVVLVLAGLGAGSGLFAQLNEAERAGYDAWEEFLRTAKVTDQRQMERIEGVTTPWVLTLEKDGVVRRGLWKDALGERVGGFKETWKGEIAAYRLSRHLGLHMVPPTVEREFRGSRGSCQLWFEAWVTMAEVRGQKLKPPGPRVAPFFRGLYLQRAFDNLVSNEDRHLRNYLIMDDWRMILIDHSRSFRTTKKFRTGLIYDEKSKEGANFIMAELPRAFVEALKTLTHESVRAVVGEYLTDEEIDAALARRDLILAWLDRRVAALGEAKVLY